MTPRKFRHLVAIMVALMICLVGKGWARPVPVSFALRSGGTELDVSHGGVSVRFVTGKPLTSFSQPQPLAVNVIDDQGNSVWLAGSYAKVTQAKAGILCVGTLTTAHETQFQITDMYRGLPKATGFTLARRVAILTPSPSDKGFNSQFSLSPDTPTGMGDDEFFAPGIWYKNSQSIPPTGLASHPDDQFFLFREDRLPLPLITVRDKRSGTTLTLAHLGGDPTTFAGEDGLNRIIDARMQFGSLGILNTNRPSPVFLLPGTEGERTYIYGGSLQKRWAYRSHPVEIGVPHAYQLLIRLSLTPNFPAALRESWRTVYRLEKPPVLKANLALAYRDEMALLSTYIHPYNGVISVPFQARVPNGDVIDTSSEMGFVGQALPCAALLLRDGLQRGDASEIARASQVVDFWAHNSSSPVGLQNSWYNILPDGSVTWRNYPVYLRIESDGMDGALQAWNLMHRHGQNRPEWLAFCRRFADWLVKNQAQDGSWAQCYGMDGHVIHPDKDTTIQPVAFLVDMFKATGDAKYRHAALLAGDFAWKLTQDNDAYAGGAPDNPNVKDKEGGICALNSYLALYDLTLDRDWVKAAAQAADYCETWTYCWNIPIPSGDPKVVIPPGRSDVGLSLIAVGQSGSDGYMAAAPFLFYRVSLLTGDTHLRDVAEMLLEDTKEFLDLNGQLGYKYPALETEAMSLPPLRGHGVHGWLPWLTVCQLTPLVCLQETFGNFDIQQIERLPHAQLLHMNAQYGKTRGF